MNEFKSNPNKSEDDPALQGFLSPKKWIFRFSGLALMCFLGFASYFCYDNPGALQDNFESDLNMSSNRYTLLYSFCSWPNIILCFVSGFLLDSVFGIRWGTVIYMSLVTFGHLLFAIGAYFDIFWLMLLGRFIFGIGTESIVVAQSSYAVLWFKDKEMNMVFGLQRCFDRLGSTVNFLIMENIYSYISENLKYTGPQRIGVILFLASITCIGSMICALLLVFMDKHAEKVLRRNKRAKSETVRLSDVKNFKYTFWLAVSVIVAYYIAVIPFVSLGKVYFMTKYELEAAVANTVNSLIYGISIVASPFIGMLIDKTGNNILWAMLSIIGSLFAHGLLAFTYISPYVCTITLGFSFAMFASSLWPLIASIIPVHQSGTAYGIALALLNLGLAMGPIVGGIIIKEHGHYMLELFFLAWLCIALVAAVIFWKKEKSNARSETQLRKRRYSLQENVQLSNELEKLRTKE